MCTSMSGVTDGRLDMPRKAGGAWHQHALVAREETFSLLPYAPESICIPIQVPLGRAQ